MIKRYLLLTLTLCLLGGIHSNAQTWTQVGADIDGEAVSDSSGGFVSLSSDGHIVAIGAWINSDNGVDAGHVRIYKDTSGSWTQVGSDIDGEAAYDQSGSVWLSSDGSTVAIGARQNDGNGTSAGHVRIYENISGTWIQVGADIDGEAAYDGSGYSVSLSSDGSTVAIGASGNDGNGTDAGHVRIYKNTNGTWTQVGADIDGEAAGDRSGNVSLSSDGSIVAIGATGNDGNGSNAGHVRIYKNISGTWTQVGADIDGEAVFDRSGYSVSLSSDGSTVAIGAYGNDGNGSNAGHVRIYKNISGTWTQVGADIDGEAAGDRSGIVSLSSDGSTVAIGAWRNDGNGSNAGHVRIYKNTSGTWTQVGADIDGEAAGDGFGGAVSLSSDGSIVAIGAPFNDGNGGGSGHVRVYKNCSTTYATDTITSCGPYTWIDGVTYTTSNYTATDTLVSATGCDSIVTLHLTIPNALLGNWTQVGADIDGEAVSDSSGGFVSLSSDGHIVAIGAWINSDNGVDAGHVRIYKDTSGSWTQVGSDIDGEAAYDQSGSVWLSSDGSTVAIGARQNDGNGTSAGHVRIYENISGTWIQVGADIDGEAAYDGSGYSVSLSSDGSTVAIGASGNDGNGTDAGHVRIYKNTNGTWTQVGADIDGEAAGDRSGNVSLSSDGSIVAIGATGNDGNGSNAGHVRIYKNISGTWTQVGADIDGEAVFDRSGYSVSLSSDGSTVAIGAYGNDGNGSNAGHVRIYKNISGTWTQVGADIDGEAAGDRSGIVSLSSDGSTVAIGAWRNDGNGSNAGHVRIYKNTSGTWTQVGADIDGEAAGDGFGGAVSLSSDGSIVAIGAPFNDGNGGGSGHVRVYKNCSTTYATDTITSCGPYTWIDGVTYTTSNYTATDTLVSAAGCDSVVTLDLTINSSNTGTDVITACDSYTWIDGNTYTASNNTATYLLNNINGCDSVVSLDLTITYSNTGQVSLNGCDQVSLNGQTYTASGTYVQNLVNSDGCDSILTINANLTYSNFIQTQPTNQSVGEGLNAVFFIVGSPTAQYQWQTNLGLGYQDLNDFGQYSGTATSSLQVSNVNLAINNNQAFRCLVTEGNCTDTSGTVVLEVVPSSSVNEFEQGIHIYPNPTQGIVKVERNNSSSPTETYQLQIVDSHGKMIQKSEVDFEDGFIVINLEDYPAGVYQLTLMNQHEVFHEKVSLVK